MKHGAPGIVRVLGIAVLCAGGLALSVPSMDTKTKYVPATFEPVITITIKDLPGSGDGRSVSQSVCDFS
jgi:hypothetical protein